MLALSLLFLLLGIIASSDEAAAFVVRRRSSTYTGFLTTRGQWFVDAAGNAVILRGANFFGYEYGLLNSHTEADYQKMASWGFNIVRLPIAWNLIEPNPKQYDDLYLGNTVDRDLVWAQKYSIHVIISMHQYCWSPHFTYCDAWTQAGVPAWGTSSYANTELGLRQAIADFWNGLGPNGTPVTQSNPSMQDRFFAMWQHVAKRYTSSTVVAGYDLFNEPYSYGWQYKYDASSLDTFSSTILPQFYTKAIDSVRAVDTNHICIWEAPSSIVLPRSNIAYSPHYPGLNDFSNYDAQQVRSAMQSLATTSQKWNVPVFIGEWGMLADASSIINYIRDFSDLLDKYLMSAAWWSYGRGGYAMYLLDQNGNERTILTQNLVRPYIGMASVFPSYSGLSTDMKQLQVGLLGPCTMNVYAPPFRNLEQVNVDSGSASGYWVAQNLVVSVSVASGAKVVTIMFA
jgi:endoglycosylceramidase